MAKTCYHSELVKLGQTEITVKSAVLQSKFGGKPPYCIIEFNGDERIYNTENPACEAALDGMEGKRLLILATGNRESAAIQVIEELGTEDRPQERQAPRQPARPATRPSAATRTPRQEPPHDDRPPINEEPPQQQADDPQAAMRLFEAKLCRRVNGFTRCLDAAVAVANKFEAKHPERDKLTTSAIKEIAVHFAIGIGDRFFESLPVKVEEKK